MGAIALPVPASGYGTSRITPAFASVANAACLLLFEKTISAEYVQTADQTAPCA